MTVRVIGPRDPRPPKTELVINTTSRGDGWERGLSPFVLGPVELWGGYKARNVENAWQYSKVYPKHVGRDGDPSNTPPNDWYQWAYQGWLNQRAVRYPMGKGAVPLYSWWGGRKLDYIEARKRIYCPLYAGAVESTNAWRRLQTLYEKHGRITLWDFDGYDHRKLGMSFRDVLNCETRKMGHAFVLAMMLQGKRRWVK